jgi:hypothetical protein
VIALSEPRARAGAAAQQAMGGWLPGVRGRERRALSLAAAVLALALLLAYGVLPFARRWSAREAVIATRSAQLARVRGLIASESTLAGAVRDRESRLGVSGPRPIEARTPALAAAGLETALQAAALSSGVQLQQLEVAEQGAPGRDEANGGAGDALPAVSATLVALGDVHGLAALLDALRRGSVLLEVTTFSAQATPGPRGEALLQLTVGVRAPWSARRSARWSARRSGP